MKNLSQYIDHTLLKADARSADIKKLCEEAQEYKFFCVCINSSYVKFAAHILRDSKVKVCTVVGFPLGACNSQTKAFEAKTAIQDGADEIDMVINISKLKDKKYDKVKEDIKIVQNECRKVTLKVIFETALLSDEEIKEVSLICKDLKVDFIKTSTGFSSRGASLNDIKIMKETVGNEVNIKASGGIRDYETAILMIEAGASRLGVSAGIAIVNGDSSSKVQTKGY